MTANSFRRHDQKSQTDVDLGAKARADGLWSAEVQAGVAVTVLEVTPVCDTSGAMADGDVISATAEVANAVKVTAGYALIHSITVLDKDDQGGALDIVLLRTNVSLGTVNGAVSISDTDAEEVLGVVSVSASDYTDLINSQVATKELVGIAIEAGAGDTSIFLGLISRDTKTYTASGLVIKLGIAQD